VDTASLELRKILIATFLPRPWLLSAASTCSMLQASADTHLSPPSQVTPALSSFNLCDLHPCSSVRPLNLYLGPSLLPPPLLIHAHPGPLSFLTPSLAPAGRKHSNALRTGLYKQGGFASRSYLSCLRSSYPTYISGLERPVDPQIPPRSTLKINVPSNVCPPRPHCTRFYTQHHAAPRICELEYYLLTCHTRPLSSTPPS
jgi:hypothetical protein